VRFIRCLHRSADCVRFPSVSLPYSNGDCG
jgi:hypothetical protein